VTNNQSYVMTNSENGCIHTKLGSDLCWPQTNLDVYQKRVYYSGVKFFNNLTIYIKNTSGNLKRYKIIFKKFLNIHCFCIRRSIIPDDTFGRWFNSHSTSILISIFIQFLILILFRFICHVLFYCKNDHLCRY